jgi:hypothetical protein
VGCEPRSVVTAVRCRVCGPTICSGRPWRANPPYLFELDPMEGRKALDEAQSGKIEKPDVDIGDTVVSGWTLGPGVDPGPCVPTLRGAACP